MPFKSPNLAVFLKEKSRSLIVRLIALALFMVVAGVAGRLAVMLPFLKESLTALTASQLLSTAEYVAKDIDERIASRRQLIGNLARHLPLHLLKDEEALTVWLGDHYKVHPLFSRGLVVVTADGSRLLGEYPEFPGRATRSFSDREWFRKVVSERKTVIGSPVLTRGDGKPAIVMAAPVFNERDELVAVLGGVAEIGASDFLEQIHANSIGKSGGFLLISPQDNLFVSSYKPEMILKPLPKPGINLLHDKAMAGFRGWGVTVNAFGIEELSAIASVPETGWFLVARVPTAEAFEVIVSVRNFILESGLGLGIAIILFLLFSLRWMFKPLVQASGLIHRMAKGETPLQPLPVVRKDEVGELAQGFNFLLARLRDMTDQKLAEERLRLTERERMEASLRQWMADTSHELRTPIAVMRAQIEAIQDGVHQADQQTMDVLLRQVMGLTRLVEDLYTLARSDTGRLDSQAVPVQPIDLLDEVVSDYQGRFAEAGLELERADIKDGDVPVILGDPARLKQVFANLLENSLRYTDRGGRLVLSTQAVGGQLLIHFDDTAPGVPGEALSRLFERFYRVDDSRSRQHGGSGIGLSVSKSLVEAMGGDISVAHSSLGGLCVTLALPLAGGAE